jgi:hypothetical protein
MRYQFDRPFMLDSTAAQRAFNLVPASTEEALGETIRAMKATAQRADHELRPRQAGGYDPSAGQPGRVRVAAQRRGAR